MLLNYWFSYPNTKEYIYLLYAIVLLAALVLNLLNVRITSMLNTISAYWHIIGVIIIVGALVVVPDNHQSLGYVFTETINETGFGGGGNTFATPMFWYVFATGLAMAQYTITGYDASAHMAEETHGASRMAAVGMVSAVVVSVIAGFILLVAITFAIPDTAGAIENFGIIIPWIWAESMSQNWSEALLFIAVVAQFFCLTASVTSASRMMFAFSRDRAVPGHALWRKVGRNRVPHYAVTAICVLAAIIMLPAIKNYLIGYYVGTGIAVVGLYIAFILPVILRVPAGRQVRARRLEPRQQVQVAECDRDHLGGLHLHRVLPAAVQGEHPGPGGLVAGTFVNYAPALVLAAFALFGGWWVLSAKNWFTGPVRMGTEEELELLEEKEAADFDLPADTQYES